MLSKRTAVLIGEQQQSLWPQSLRLRSVQSFSRIFARNEVCSQRAHMLPTIRIPLGDASCYATPCMHIRFLRLPDAHAYVVSLTITVLQSVQKKLTRGSLSVVENAIYDAWERLSSDATRSFAVKFPRYAETVVRAWVNRVWPAGVVQIPEFFTEVF